MITFSSLRHAYPERNGLVINRPKGYGEYTFLHFFQSVDILVNGEMVTTKPDAVIIYDETTPQYFKIEEPLVHNWMHFRGDFKAISDKYGLCVDTIYYPENPAFITDLCYELEAEFYGRHTHSDTLLQLKFEELFLKLSRAINGQGIPHISKKSKRKFQQLRRELFFDLSRHYTVEEMSAMVGYSQSRFYTIYKSFYGISPTNDLINARMEKAKEMLFDENMTIGEIAAILGYENTTHFVRQFKSRIGMPPMQYRMIVLK